MAENDTTITVALDEQASAELSALRTELEQARSERAAETAAREAMQAEFAQARALLEAEQTRRAALEAEARRTRFVTLTEGWYGVTAENVGLLETLADALGEDSPTFAGFVQRERAQAAQIATGPLFKEIGSDAPATADGDDAIARFNAAVERVATERKIDHAAAFDVVQAEDKALAAAYVATQRARG